jgi:hypothetical protein
MRRLKLIKGCKCRIEEEEEEFTEILIDLDETGYVISPLNYSGMTFCKTMQ